MKIIIFTLFSFFGLCSSAFSQYLLKEGVIQKHYDYNNLQIKNFSDNSIYISGYGGKNYNRSKTYDLIQMDWNGNIQTSNNNVIVEQLFEVKNPVTNNLEKWGIGVDRFYCGICYTGIYGQWAYSLLDNGFNQTSAYFLDQFYFNSELYPYYFDYYPVANGLAYTSSGSVVAATEHVFQKLNANPQNNSIDYFVMDTINIDVKGMFPYSIDTFLVFSENSISKIDTLGNQLDLNLLPFTIIDVQSVTDSTFLINASSNPYILNKNGEVIDSLIVSNYIDEVYHLIYKNDKFYLLGKVNNSIQFSTVFNGNIISSWSIDTLNFNPTKFELDTSSEKVIFIGNETGHKNKHLMYQIYSNVDLNYEKSNFDVTLNELINWNTQIDICYYQEPSTATRTFYKYRPEFSITNNSNQVVNELFINGSWKPTPMPWTGWECLLGICEDTTAFLKFDNLNLQPNQNTIIQFPMFYFVEPGIVPACFWLTAPNAEADRNPADNELCFDLPVSLKEINLEENEFNLFPNPSYGLFNLEIKSLGAEQIQVYNLLGESILVSQISGTYTQLDLTHLAKGVYIVQFRDNKGIKKSRKVILQ